MAPPHPNFMALDCPKCGTAEASKLIAGPKGLGCNLCLEEHRISFDGLIHRVRLDNGAVRMTWADAMRIKTNKKRSDGTYKPDPRWR